MSLFRSKLKVSLVWAQAQMSSLFPLQHGLYAEVIPDQCILISGKTFDQKDRLKSLGGIWAPDLKKWKFPLNADLSSLQPQVRLQTKPAPQPAPRIIYAQRPRRPGRCCSKCQVMIDKKRPDGPLWYVCPDHGTYQSDYTGD